MTTIYVRPASSVSGFRNFPPLVTRKTLVRNPGGNKDTEDRAEREGASCLKFLNPQNNRSLFLKRCT